jgi:hypothetical protein
MIAPLFALLPVIAQAQCVQCFRTAAAQQAARASWLNLGILILLVPALALLAGFGLLAYRRRHG